MIKICSTLNIQHMKLLLIGVMGILSMVHLPSLAQEKIGVVLMHGKQGGGPRDTSLESLHRKMDEAGMLVLKPEMPWSYRRFIEGDWNLAMTEIDSQVQKLKASGATKVVLVGHSLGSPAALSYASRHPDQVHALGLLAPGHVPLYYSLCIPYSPIQLCAVKDGVQRAQQALEAGNGDKKIPLPDINQGRTNVVWMTPKDYLSYFDPASDAEMAVTAPKLPTQLPVLWVIGDGDRLIKQGRQYVFDKLPMNAKSHYLEVQGNHLSTPSVASDQILSWIRSAVQP